MRTNALAVIAALVVTALSGGDVQRRTYRHIKLCVLKAAPGNAFTFVPPPPVEARPQGGAPTSTINVTYTGFGSVPAAQAAFDYAVSIWETLISSPVPISVSASFTPLPQGELGNAGANQNYVGTPNAIPQTFYGDPLADRLAVADQAAGSFDITAEFNSTANWYYGTDGNPGPGQYDFVSVVLHELAHGLGFVGFSDVTGGVGEVGAGGIPGIYDLFTVDENGTALFGYPNPSTQLGTVLTSAFNPMDPTGPGAYWGGTEGVLANGGQPPRLYTPSPYVVGSSYHHLDENVFPPGNAHSLMTFQISAAEAIHSPGSIVLGMFDDMGWQGVQPELIANGSFSSGLAGWQLFDGTDIVHNNASGGIFEYRKADPTTLSGSAVVLQNTGAALAAGDQVLINFQVGNSSPVRKRISLLVHDGDFSDLSVCTFWLPASAGLQNYQMITHTTEAWTNASVSFYAASPGTGGGFYLLDNVSMREVPAAYGDNTTCYDPWGPIAPGGADSAEMLTNRDFSGGLPPWQTFGTITHQISSGVFEFTRDNATPPAGVVLQPTGQAVNANSIVTAFFDLGNSSGVRKRVTVLIHDLDFSDLSACTFWLSPGQPLSTYAMRSYATEAWTNATLSVYAASVGTQQWSRLDNASLKVTPGSPTAGTDCGEPGSGLVNGMAVAGPEAGATPWTFVRPESGARQPISRRW